MEDRKAILVLALGNEYLRDDGVGIFAGRVLQEKFGERVDVIEAPESGLGLLDHIVPYKRVLMLDAIQQGGVPGAIKVFSVDQLPAVESPSPHYIGVPMAIEIARRLGLDLPDELLILAMEVEDPFAITEGLTELVARALPDYIEQASTILEGWLTLPSAR